MSHNINEGRMFYYGKRPWHGIGVELSHPATAREAVQAARLDYNVDLQKIYTEDRHLIFNRFATFRTDTKIPLGVVGDSYRVIQNDEAFAFFDSVVGDGQAIYHTAGALGRGERIWILAKLPTDIIVAKDDIIERFLCLTNSHDGKSALRLYFTPVRVVCQNTLMMSMTDANDGVSIRHTGNISGKVDEARRILGLSIRYYDDLANIAKRMIDIKLNIKDVERYFEQVIIGERPLIEKSTRLINQRDELLTLFENGKGNNKPEVKHSLWSAYNAVAEWTDHSRTVRGEDKDISRRLNSIWFGSAAYVKNRAFNYAMKLVK